MSSRRRFEGTHLEEVLERVRTELGPEAKIVSADKVRSGGVAGFFQREGYEVLAEVPAKVSAGDVPAGDASARSISDLAEQVSDDEADARVSTESATFEATMRRLAADFPGDDEIVPPAPAAAYTEAADHYLSDRYLGDGSLDDNSLDDNSLDDDSLDERAPVDLRRGGLDGVGPRRGDVRRWAPPARREPSLLPSMLGEPDESAFGRLGLPPALVPPADVARRDLRRALVERLRALPPAPPLPRDAGSVIAIIGDAAGSLTLARVLANELRLEADGVLLATAAEHGICVPSWLHLADPELVARRRRTWWRRQLPTVVAIDAPLSISVGEWAPAIIDALEPTMVFGVVDARRKPEDVEAWSGALGGVDALALEHLSETASPAAVLRLPIPVVRLDGRVATPERWATLLTKRLAA